MIQIGFARKYGEEKIHDTNCMAGLFNLGERSCTHIT